MLELDHLAVAASTLADGVAAVEAALGVKLSGGGEHPLMGTHNRLLGLGGVYLEVIAINPDVPAPDHPRWFDLDNFSGKPCLTNWIVRSDDLAAAIKGSPKGIGTPVALTRGDLRWQMAVPGNGKLPYDGAFPALIEWQGTAHPAARLPETGCRLLSLEITHPDANGLRATLALLLPDARIEISQGPAPAFCARIKTPHGVRELR